MNKQNSLDQIKKAENESRSALEETRERAALGAEKEKGKGEARLSGLGGELSSEIKKMFARADEEIEKIRQKIRAETEAELKKIKNLPEEKKKKAVAAVVNKVNER